MLPITTTFRVCDIWRGFWVQRLLWDINGRLVFGTATVQQLRNKHSLIDDMDQEYQLYHESGSFVRFLSNWSSDLPTIEQRIEKLFRDMVERKFFKLQELNFIRDWLNDLRSINYSFPKLVKTPETRKPKKRTAVCVTGILECVQEAWSVMHKTIKQHVDGGLDTFLFLSSSDTISPVRLHDRSKQAREYLNSTVAVFYNDQDLDPKIPSKCPFYFEPHFPEAVIKKYYQQLWALSECFDLVRDFERKTNVRYDYLIRTRVDIFLEKVPSRLLPSDQFEIVIPDEDHFGGYNDRFAVGSMSSMEKYMRRWHDLKHCYAHNLHAEHFLKSTLEKYSITVKLEKNLTLFHVPHGLNQCH